MAAADPRDEIDKIVVVRNEDFATHGLGKLYFYMGCARTQDLETSKLSTVLTVFFAETLARRFDVTTTSLYLDYPGADLGTRVEGDSDGTWAYGEAVGGLMWLTVMSRSNIANTVRAVARHSHSATAKHCNAVLMIIEHLSSNFC